jgi:hypothetical protein
VSQCSWHLWYCSNCRSCALLVCPHCLIEQLCCLKIIGLEHDCDPCFISCSKEVIFGSMGMTSVLWDLMWCKPVEVHLRQPATCRLLGWFFNLNSGAGFHMKCPSASTGLNDIHSGR